MRIRIDTKAKTIAIEETVTFDELHKMLKSLFPEDYKEWKVETNVKFEVASAPIIYREYHPYHPYRPYRPYWENPFYYGSAWCGTTAGGICETQAAGGSSSVSDNLSSNVAFLDYQPDWTTKTQAGATITTN